MRLRSKLQSGFSAYYQHVVVLQWDKVHGACNEGGLKEYLSVDLDSRRILVILALWLVKMFQIQHLQ